MKFDLEYLAELLQEENPGKAIGEMIIDDDSNIDEDDLQKLCSNGGWPENPQYSYDNSEQVENTYVICLTVYLDEKYSGACADMPHKEPQKGSITATVDLKTGEVDFKAVHEDHVEL